MPKNQTRNCSILVISIFSMILTFLPVSSSLSSSKSDGIKWLTTLQNQDGSWGTGTELFILDTTTVLDTFKYLSVNNSPYANGVIWLSNQSPLSTDFLSKKAKTLYMASIDASADLATLLSRGVGGGWGGDIDYKDTVLDTAFVLEALKSASYTDQTIISSALGYLVSTQNPDGGWGFYPSACSNCEADPSNVYMTATVLQTLSQYKTIYNLETAINNGVAYLLTKENSDGGFGSSPSTVYETAVALLALIMDGQGQAQPLQNAINYLTSTQLPDGSWVDDPYSTALALRALGHVKPNLSISASDIAFSNPNPRIGDTVTITVAIYNEGPATLSIGLISPHFTQIYIIPNRTSFSLKYS